MPTSCTPRSAVIVEAVVDRRPESELGPGHDGHDGLGHDVCGGVAHDRQVVVAALAGNDLDGITIGEWTGKITDLACDLGGDRSLRKTRSDRGGGVMAGRALRQVEPAAVWQEYVHGARG